MFPVRSNVTYFKLSKSRTLALEGSTSVTVSLYHSRSGIQRVSVCAVWLPCYAYSLGQDGGC